MFFKDSAPLTREDEVKFVRLARRGDKAAVDRLVKSNLRLINKIAMSYQGRDGGHVDVGEYVNEGVVGFMKGLPHFEPARKLRLGTYMVHWIRAFISRFSRMIREKQMSSLDEPISRYIDGADDEVTVLDMLSSPDQLPDSALEEKQLKERIYEAMGTLDERDQMLARERILKSTTLDTLGIQIGVSRERVRQMEIGVRNKLAYALKTPDSQPCRVFRAAKGGRRRGYRKARANVLTAAEQQAIKLRGAGMTVMQVAFAMKISYNWAACLCRNAKHKQAATNV